MTLGMSMTLTWEQTGQWNKIDSRTRSQGI